MYRMIYDHTKRNLERVSNDPKRFERELVKAYKSLEPHELSSLEKWLIHYAAEKKELTTVILYFCEHLPAVC